MSRERKLWIAVLGSLAMLLSIDPQLADALTKLWQKILGQ